MAWENMETTPTGSKKNKQGQEFRNFEEFESAAKAYNNRGQQTQSTRSNSGVPQINGSGVPKPKINYLNECEEGYKRGEDGRCYPVYEDGRLANKDLKDKSASGASGTGVGNQKTDANGRVEIAPGIYIAPTMIKQYRDGVVKKAKFDIYTYGVPQYGVQNYMGPGEKIKKVKNKIAEKLQRLPKEERVERRDPRRADLVNEDALPR